MILLLGMGDRLGGLGLKGFLQDLKLRVFFLEGL